MLSFSARSCRAWSSGVPSLKTMVMTETPWMDSERIDSWLPSPLMAVSSGRVTSVSTCSAERPGASAWTVTLGGTKSGKTSSLAWDARYAPYATSTAARTRTTLRYRSEKRTMDCSRGQGRLSPEGGRRRTDDGRQMTDDGESHRWNRVGLVGGHLPSVIWPRDSHRESLLRRAAEHLGGEQLLRAADDDLVGGGEAVRDDHASSSPSGRCSRVTSLRSKPPSVVGV